MTRGGQAARWIRLVALVLGSIALASLRAAPGRAQQVQLEVAPGPYYQGQSIELQVVAKQFEEEPPPEIEFDPQDGVSLRSLGVSPSTSTSISIVNGRVSRIHEVTFVYRYELSSVRLGTIRVPEFRVRQGATLRRTQPVALQIAAVPRSDEFGISVVMPAGPIFVGQKVPVAIEFRLDRAVQQDLIAYQIQIPLFDAPGVRFVDTSPPRADTQLEVQTGSGVLQFPAVTEERTIGGRESLVVRFERTLIAQKSGEIAAAAPTVTIERGVQFRRDLFGQRRAMASQRSISAGRPLRIEVAEVPASGRPASFAGAVGSGFSLEVTADRSVVQLGEPIELTFHLRGHGDLSTAGLPPLDAAGMLDPARFRLPDEAPAGILDEDGKRFRVTLRVLDANVREIPAIAYSWFDADTRRFETVRSQPIALSVGAAEVVGADAVASRSGDEVGGSASGPTHLGPDDAGAASPAAAREAGAPADAATRRSSLAESAANLAVEADPDVLLRAAQARRGAGLVTGSLYGVGLMLLGYGFFDRRRRAVDPRLRERQACLDRAKRAVEAALAPGRAEGAAALARALRELVAAMPDEVTPELDAIVAECDALRFAPSAGARGASGSGVPPVLAERARRMIASRLAAGKTIPSSAGAGRGDARAREER